MRKNRLMTLGFTVLLAWGPATGTVEDRIAQIQDPGRPAEEREAALVDLQGTASGDLKLEETREANFFLCRYYLDTLGKENRLTRQYLVSATSLYPDDPRTPGLLLELATSELERHDPFGAHNAFLRLMKDEFIENHPDLAVLAAENAARAGDMPTAFLWSQSPDPEKLSEDDRIRRWVAVLRSGYAIGRQDVALQAAEELLGSHPETVRTDPGALFDAARLMEAVGRDQEAAKLYQSFANIHISSEHRPDAMLSLAGAFSRLGETENARRTYHWLEENYPETPQAQEARMALLSLDGRPIAPERLSEYIATARQARDAGGAREACDTLFDRFFGQGFPIEAISALGYLARNDDGSLAFLAAQESMARGIGAAVELLDSRGDIPGIVLVAEQATSVGVRIPKAQRKTVNAARRSMGLAPYQWSNLQYALDRAKGAARRQEWSRVVELLGDELRYDRNPDPVTRRSATLLLAEALWRQGRDEEAEALIDEIAQKTETGEKNGTESRPALVLQADMLFASGDTEGACPLYAKAQRIRKTPWVDRQVQRCVDRREPAAEGDQG